MSLAQQLDELKAELKNCLDANERAQIKAEIETIEAKRRCDMSTIHQDIDGIIDAAKALGIVLTNAEIGTEICQSWCDRVLWAKACWDQGKLDACQAAIDEANRYAI
jgi:hypothetical protein